MHCSTLLKFDSLTREVVKIHFQSNPSRHYGLLLVRGGYGIVEFVGCCIYVFRDNAQNDWRNVDRVALSCNCHFSWWWHRKRFCAFCVCSFLYDSACILLLIMITMTTTFREGYGLHRVQCALITNLDVVSVLCCESSAWNHGDLSRSSGWYIERDQQVESHHCKLLG